MNAVTNSSVKNTDKIYYNSRPDDPFKSISELRQALVRSNSTGDDYLNYLLTGDYFTGKDLWISHNKNTRLIYENILRHNPHLITESPYTEFIKNVDNKSTNKIELSNIKDAPKAYQKSVENHKQSVLSGDKNPKAIFCGGPAAKIAATLACLNNNKNLKVLFLIDGAEQSNESSSASYEHINHANALNAEYDNTSFGILPSVLKRALFGEKNPAVALNTDYKKVDLWPNSIVIKDIYIYAYYTVHGIIQWAKKKLHIINAHDKSRMASKKSTQVLNYIERKTGIALKLSSIKSRAIILNYTKKEHIESIKDDKYMRRSINLTSKKLTKQEISEYYSLQTCRHISSADIFHENNCIVHGFDRVIKKTIINNGGDYQDRIKIKEIFFEASRDDTVGTVPVVVGILAEEMNNKENNKRFIPVDYLGLSLGYNADYTFSKKSNDAGLLGKFLNKVINYNRPVPYQTIATGVSCQVLFKITDKNKFDKLPHSGLKQTHFVEMGSDNEHLLVKLTAGGNISNKKYSRSYALSALSNMMRVLTPECGLEYIDVVSAWPCSRGINGSNNGVIVRLGENMALRYAEGSTGMSKMGSNGQTILDMLGIDHGLTLENTTRYNLYKHTVIDNRRKVVKNLHL